jgi:Rieske Fe-S protein
MHEAGISRFKTRLPEEDSKLQNGARRIGRRLALEVGFCLVLAPDLALAQTEGDLLVPVGNAAPEPLPPDDVPLGGKQIFAWPIDPASSTVRSGSRLDKVLLLRLDPESFDPMTKEHAVAGVIAYSAICPHTGCDVTSWHADRQLLECPCRYSTYDPKEAAKVVSGPTPRPLPALPLKIADGRLVVAKPFTGRAGFQQM